MENLMKNTAPVNNIEFINDTEKVVYQIKSENNDQTITEFCLTNQNLYVSEITDTNRNNLHIIKKSEITAVSINSKKDSKNVNILLLIATFIFFAGIITPIVTSIYPFFTLAAVGLIMIIVGIVLSRPNYEYIISIYTPSPINIKIDNIPPQQLKTLQTEILKND